MIFTLGKMSIYESYILNDENAAKKGRGFFEDGSYYCGGSVWKTQEETSKFLQEGFAVYGVLADWEKDTEISKDGAWNDLLIDAKLIKIWWLIEYKESSIMEVIIQEYNVQVDGPGCVLVNSINYFVKGCSYFSMNMIVWAI